MAEYVKRGNEFLVNTQTGGDQRVADSDVLVSGSYAVVWRSADPAAPGIRLQLFDAAGAPIGGETSVTAGQFDAKVTALAGGGFIVSWLDANNALKGQLYDAGGSKLGAAFGILDLAMSYDVAAAQDGGFFVTNYANLPADQAIVGQFFTAVGTPRTASFVIALSGNDINLEPEVTALANGNFVVVWQAFSTFERTFYDIEGRVVTSAGTFPGNEFIVGSLTTGIRSDPAITALTNGGFVVRFDNFEPDPVTGAARQTMGLQLFNAQGLRVGDQILREIGTFADQPYAEESLAALPDGGFVTVWETGSEIYVQTFDASGGPLAEKEFVNSTVPGIQSQPAVASQPDGSFLVTWTDASGTGGDVSGTAIRGQLYAPPPPVPPQSITGTEGDDVLAGGAGDDTIDGLGGNDNLSGGDGADVIRGGPGDDYLNGGKGTNTLFGDDGNDALDGGAFGETLIGGSGDDIVLGNGGDDQLQGGEGADRLIGGEGNDFILGGAGVDALGGGAGSDLLDGGIGADYMDGGSGSDTHIVDDPGDSVVEAPGGGSDTVRTNLAQYRAPANIETLLYTGAGAFEAAGTDTSETIDAGQSTLGAILQGFGGDDQLIGGTGNDNLSGGVGSDGLFGGGGDDYLNTGDGAFDFASGGTGNDAIEGGAGDDTLHGEDGDDILLGAGGADRLEGGAGNDRVIGGDGNDMLEGGTGNDAIGGGAGNDTLRGDAGADYMDGGSGNDLYFVDDPGDAVIEAPGEGTDIVAVTLASYVLRANVENLNFGGTDYKIGVGNDLGNHIRLQLSSGGQVQAGGGNDIIDGSEGADNLSGEAGDDTILGGGGDDYLNGGAGNNFLDGGAGNDSIEGGSDAESLYGWDGNDILLGNGGADRLEGGDGSDTLVGGSGDDILIGGASDDRMSGGDGADTLTGGAGTDYLEGNAGADRFVFTADGVATTDTVVGFSSAEGDKFDFSAIDANTSVAGDQAFTFVGANAFSGAAGELRVQDGGGGTYVISGDTNGDGLADFSVILRGALQEPVAADFIP